MDEYIRWMVALVLTVMCIGMVVAVIGFCVCMLHEGYKLFKRWGK